MANPNEIKSLSQHSTAEDYTRPFIVLPFQLISSYSDDIFGTRYRLDFHHFCDWVFSNRAAVFAALKPVHEFGHYQRRI